MSVSHLSKSKNSKAQHTQSTAQLWGQAHSRDADGTALMSLAYLTKPRTHTHAATVREWVAHRRSAWGNFQLFLVWEYLVLGGDSRQCSFVKIYQTALENCTRNRCVCCATLAKGARLSEPPSPGSSELESARSCPGMEVKALRG